MAAERGGAGRAIATGYPAIYLNNLLNQYPFQSQKPESTMMGKITHLTALAA
jgi:hypothetical protein